MRRSLYKTISACLMAGSFAVGVWVTYLETQVANYVVTLNPSQTQVNISTMSVLFSVALFLCGALFSAGLAMGLNLIELEKK